MAQALLVVREAVVEQLVGLAHVPGFCPLAARRPLPFTFI
jgi:hypothetical protein